LVCQQGISRAKLDKKKAALEDSNQKWCSARGGELKKGYDLRCRDGQCKLGTLLVAGEFAAECLKYSLFFTETGQKWALRREKDYYPGFERLIAESIQRDPKATAAELLAAHGCRPFLGREAQSLCEDEKGFSVCKKLVDAKRQSQCLLAGTKVVYPLAKAGTAADIPIGTVTPGTAAGAGAIPPASPPPVRMNVPAVLKGMTPASGATSGPNSSQPAGAVTTTGSPVLIRPMPAPTSPAQPVTTTTTPRLVPIPLPRTP
jgi:hypothetical protein